MYGHNALADSFLLVGRPQPAARRRHRYSFDDGPAPCLGVLVMVSRDAAGLVSVGRGCCRKEEGYRK